MLTIDQIREAMEDRNMRVVASRAGISYRTLIRLLNGEGEPQPLTIQKVSDYLKRETWRGEE